MSERAIVVKDLHESFRFKGDRTKSLKGAVSTVRPRGGRRIIHALKGVSLEVIQSESIGLIGENGSGKSTLLRCIAGILPPTSGEVLVAGTVSSLIELGAGFHSDLTGRENAMVTGLLFGLSRRQLREQFDEIVSFGGLEEMIDSPVRTYSSGMHLRLAFSLAVHARSNILLIDEALAVGDEAFQMKSIQKVVDLVRGGVTVVFVSHDMSLINRICSRCIMLDDGTILADGDPQEITDKYLEMERTRALGDAMGTSGRHR